MKWVEQQNAISKFIDLDLLISSILFPMGFKTYWGKLCLHVWGNNEETKQILNLWNKQEVDMKLTPSKKINPHVLLPYSEYVALLSIIISFQTENTIGNFQMEKWALKKVRDVGLWMSDKQ